MFCMCFIFAYIFFISDTMDTHVLPRASYASLGFFSDELTTVHVWRL